MVRSGHMTHFIAPVERYYLRLRARWIDGFVSAAILARGSDEVDRARVLVASCWTTAAWAAACSGVAYYLEGLSPTAIAFGVGVLLASASALLLLCTHSVYSSSVLYCFGVLVVLTFIATQMADSAFHYSFGRFQLSP
jgi:hypothetical protein